MLHYLLFIAVTSSNVILMLFQNTLLMEKKNGDSSEIRALHDKISQLNQQIASLTDDKVKSDY